MLKHSMKKTFIVLATVLLSVMLIVSCKNSPEKDEDSAIKLTYVLKDVDGNYEGSFKDSSAKTVVKGVEKVTLPTASDLTAPTGTTFDGWYTEKDSSGNRTYYAGGAEFTLTQSTKLYANWIDNSLEYKSTESDATVLTVIPKADVTATTYKVSSWYHGKKVTVVGDFQAVKDYITSIKLPDTIKTISNSAFRYCSKMTSCNLPDGLETIGSNAFEDAGLTGKVTLPASVTSIGSLSFTGNSKLTSFEFAAGSTLTEIPSHMFSGCGFTSFPELPTTVTKIGSCAFQQSSLKNVSIPNTITEIAASAFYDCGSLETVEIGTGITKIATDAFDGCSSLASITIKKPTADVKNITGWDSCWRVNDSEDDPDLVTTKVYSSEGQIR